jgi:ketosteroid isomerase-like protein
MKYLLSRTPLIALALVASAFSISSFASNSETELRAANDHFYTALNSMFVGDLEPMNNIWSHQDDVTDLDPFGGRLVGWNKVGAEFKKEAKMKLGGRVVAKDIIAIAGNDMGYIVCVEEGENMSAAGKPVRVKHRTTNIFRREDGGWKLAHHHTDLSPELQKAFKKVKD